VSINYEAKGHKSRRLFIIKITSKGWRESARRGAGGRFGVGGGLLVYLRRPRGERASDEDERRLSRNPGYKTIVKDFSTRAVEEKTTRRLFPLRPAA
jgi:hypothetical protein